VERFLFLASQFLALFQLCESFISDLGSFDQGSFLSFT
jgi:hypothetical protein